MRDLQLVALGCRFGFGVFTIYLMVMVAAIMWPAAFDIVMGVTNLRWADFSGLSTGGELNLALMRNMILCGLIPTAYMAARVAFFGKWTALDRGFFLCMLGGNLVVNVWSIASNSAMAKVVAGDFVLVVVLISLAALRRPASDEAGPAITAAR